MAIQITKIAIVEIYFMKSNSGLTLYSKYIQFFWQKKTKRKNNVQFVNYLIRSNLNCYYRSFDVFVMNLYCLSRPASCGLIFCKYNSNNLTNIFYFTSCKSFLIFTDKSPSVVFFWNIIMKLLSKNSNVTAWEA